jgi:hypothetical protein
MPFLVASMVAFNDLVDHLPLGFLPSTLFVLLNLYIVFDIV